MKIPYYVVAKRRGYWRPSRRMKELGFTDIRCGPDGPSAWATAEEWNRRWQAVRRGEALPPAEQQAANLSPEEAEERAVYPIGSVGDAFRRFRKTDAWEAKKPRTKEMWWRAWWHIKPVFADVAPATVTPEMMSDWYTGIRREFSLDRAHKAMKGWRALWTVMAAFKLCHGDSDPSRIIRNTAPKGRSATWSEGEAVRLAKHAIRRGYTGLACIIATAWDTQFSPIDCRMAKPSQYLKDKDGAFFVKLRSKTEWEAVGTLSRRTERLIGAYLEDLGIELHPDAPMLRSRSGQPYSKDILSRDFRRIRNELFPGDPRKLMDFRRSGAIEAAAGEVDAIALSTKMANSIHQSKTLQDTYLPKRVATVRAADRARVRGRQVMRGNES